MSDYKIGINLGWTEENLTNEQIFNNYKEWLDVCYYNSISIVRVFSVRWSLNFLFSEEKLDIFKQIVAYANSKQIEVIPVLNHYTDFITEYYRDLDSDKYIWNTYPLNNGSIKFFFKGLNEEFLSKVKKVLKGLSEFSNVKTIELFNELDLVQCSSDIKIKWINCLYNNLNYYNNRFDFKISVSNDDDYSIYRNNIINSINIDLHNYSYPTNSFYKNAELLEAKHNTDFSWCEYAKNSDEAYLKNNVSLKFFCSGIWSGYLLGKVQSPMHWWWNELLNNKKYLYIIKLFNISKPLGPKIFNDFTSEICEKELITNIGEKQVLYKKIYFRIWNIVKHPLFIGKEYKQILKFVKKRFALKLSEEVLIRGFEKDSKIFFYCETLKNAIFNFNININLSLKSSNKAKVINLITGQKSTIFLKKVDKNTQLSVSINTKEALLIMINK